MAFTTGRSGAGLRAAALISTLILAACDPGRAPPGRLAPSPADPVAPESAAGGGSDDDPGGAGGSELPACEDGATRPCHVELGTHEGIRSCFEGVEVCERGRWSHCRDPPDTDVTDEADDDTDVTAAALAAAPSAG